MRINLTINHCEFYLINDTLTIVNYNLSLHDALPIFPESSRHRTRAPGSSSGRTVAWTRSEEHTSELQSQFHLVCCLLHEKKNNHEKVQNKNKNYNRPL